MTPSDAERMVHTMCAAADAGDGDTFAAFFSDTAHFRFANAAPLTGRAAIAASTSATVSAIHPVHHVVDQIAAIDDQLFCRFTIEVTMPDDTVVGLPCVTVITLSDNLIVDYRVHMDITPALLTP